MSQKEKWVTFWKNHFIILLIAIIPLLNCSCTEFKHAKTLYSSDYGMGQVKDATPVALQMIRDARKKGATKIVIEKGTYHFFPDKAFEKYCSISNHDNGLRRTPFPIIEMKNLKVVAQNADFVFHGLMVPFIIENSSHIKLSGFSIDWNLPLHSEALVVNNDPNKHTFDIQISKQYPYEVRNGKLVFLKYGYEHNLERAIFWDPQTKAVAYNTIKYSPFLPYKKNITTEYTKQINYAYPQNQLLPVNKYRGKEYRLRAKELKQGLVRISGSPKRLPKVGWILIAKGRNGFNRQAPAIRIRDTKNIKLEGINIYHAGGMGVIAEHSENLWLDNVNIKPSPGSNRMLSTTADATHFVNCRGYVKLTNCTFSNQLDDATNVHGIFMIVDKVLGKNKIRARIGHFQQFGFHFADAGDDIGFINPNKSIAVKSKNIVKKVNKVNKSNYEITFKKPIDKHIEKGNIIENLNWYPTVTIKNCIVKNNRARGFLISTPRKVLIEGNYFSTSMAAILVPVELGHWYESGQAQNLTIRDNTFGDCVYMGGNQSIIDIKTSFKKNYVFGRIVVENNKFNSFDSAVLSANQVENLVFKDNEIVKSATYPPLHPQNPVLYVSDSDSVIIENNSYKGEALNKINIREGNKHVLFKRNSGF